MSRTTIETQLYEAIRYALDRGQSDPDFRYHMIGSETHERLIAAEALYLNEEPPTVRARRTQDRQPSYRRQEPREITLQAEIDDLERRLDEAKRRIA